MAIKRLRYFNHQFLDERDFRDEQQYHIAMRHRHNRVLHSPGIAEGLEVRKISDLEVQVQSGVAIDEEGREIVLDTEVRRAVAEHLAHREGYVVIKHRDEESDHHAREGVEGFTRITESPEVSIVFERPAEGVLLGRLELDPYGVIQRVDEAVRKHSGTRSILSDGSVTIPKLAPEVVALIERRERPEVVEVIDEKNTGPIREQQLSAEIRAKLLENESVHDYHLARDIREKLARGGQSPVAGWVRLPFKPSKMSARRPPHQGDFPEFLIDAGVTYCSNNRGAKGWMSIPIPIGAQRVTTFRLAGETAGTLAMQMYKSSWNRTQRKCEVRQILNAEVHFAELHEYSIKEPDQILDPELDALSIVVTAAGLCEICLVAIRFE